MPKTLVRAQNAAEATVHALRHLEGALPHEILWRSGPVALRRYPGQGPSLATTPLLLVTPIINRYRVVDLQAGISLVEGLVEQGITVYVMDWGDARRIDASIDFEDYVLRWLPRAVDTTGVEQVDLLGYCLGGTLATLFAARFPERVRRLVTVHTPIDFSCERAHMDLLRRWVDPSWFPVERITGAFGNMPGALINQGFLWQKPLETMHKPWRTWERFDDASFAKFFAVLESWNNDQVDVPGAAYRRLIKSLYRDNALAQGRFVLGGQTIDLARISCPLLVVTAQSDTTCPPEAATALLRLVSTPAAAQQHLPVKGGHVATVAGPKARVTLHTPVAEWLRK